MTLVLQGNGWYMETFVVVMAAVADQAARVTPHTLERPGIYIGHSITQQDNASPANTTGLANPIARNISNNQLLVGQKLQNFETVVRNDSGMSVDMGETCIMFLREHR